MTFVGSETRGTVVMHARDGIFFLYRNVSFNILNFWGIIYSVVADVFSWNTHCYSVICWLPL
jgi:hypothetical protein